MPSSASDPSGTAASKVTGSAQYGADMRLPGLLYGKVLRSPHAHARIRSIDTSKASAFLNGAAVVTSADLPPSDPVAQGVVLGQTPSQNILAKEKVLYKGHPVAAVAAGSPHVAEEALSLIDVVYEPMPHVTNVEEAMKPDAPILHEHAASKLSGPERCAYAATDPAKSVQLSSVES
jgi:CO/xanthine dehydrogenase Mo-binding subunit